MLPRNNIPLNYHAIKQRPSIPENNETKLKENNAIKEAFKK